MGCQKIPVFVPLPGPIIRVGSRVPRGALKVRGEISFFGGVYSFFWLGLLIALHCGWFLSLEGSLLSKGGAGNSLEVLGLNPPWRAFAHPVGALLLALLATFCGRQLGVLIALRPEGPNFLQ